MSEIKVNKISPATGTDVTLGDSGDTFTIPSGATITNSGTATGFPEYNDDQLQSNVAMLGFYVSVNGSLVKYNLVDQVIDEYFDTSGVDAAASTDAARVASGSNYYYHGANIGGQTSKDTSVAGQTILVCSAATGSIVVGATGDVDILVVAGGASGGAYYGGGGGAVGHRLVLSGSCGVGGRPSLPQVIASPAARPKPGVIMGTIGDRGLGDHIGAGRGRVRFAKWQCTVIVPTRLRRSRLAASAISLPTHHLTGTSRCSSLRPMRRPPAATAAPACLCSCCRCS